MFYLTMYFFFFQTDTVRVIWALHDSDPKSLGDLAYHTKRDKQSVYLLGPPTLSVPEDAKRWDLTLNNVSRKKQWRFFLFAINFLLMDNEEKLHFWGIFDITSRWYSRFIRYYF